MIPKHRAAMRTTKSHPQPHSHPWITKIPADPRSTQTSSTMGRHPTMTVLLWRLLLITFCSSITGCAGIFLGSAATGAVVANDTRTTGTIIEDQSIELKAYKTISDDQQLRDQTHINVTSYNTIVLLTGEAPDMSLRDRVIEKVRHVDKVRHIYDEIQILAPSSLGSRSADSMVTAKVKTRLFTEKEVDATRVKVVTENGVVYLMGIIPRAKSALASEAVRTVSGVERVVLLFEFTD